MKKSIILSLLLSLLIFAACERKKHIETIRCSLDGTLYESCGNPLVNKEININFTISDFRRAFALEKSIYTDSLGHFSFSDSTIREVEGSVSINLNLHFSQGRDYHFNYPPNYNVEHFQFIEKDTMRQNLYFYGKNSYTNLDTVFYTFINDTSKVNYVLANEQNVLLKEIVLPVDSLKRDAFDGPSYTLMYYGLGRSQFNARQTAFYFYHTSCAGVQNQKLRLP